MSKQSSDDFIEIRPGDVVHVNETPTKRTPPPPAETEDKKEPVRRPRPPAFDIPPVEEKKPELRVRPTVPRPPDPRPPAESAEETEAEAEEPESEEADELVPEPLPEEAEPPVEVETVREETKPSLPDISDAPIIPPPPAEPPSAPDLRIPPQAQSENLNFDSPPEALPAPELSSQPLRIPAPLPSSLPPGSSPTTDLQGNLPATPLAIPPTPIPTPDIWPPVPPKTPVADATEPETTDESDLEDAETAVRQSAKGLKIFGVVTLFFIISTIATGFFFFGPMLRQALDSRRLDAAREFEHVLVNLLQVDNQELEVKLTDSQIENIAPSLGSQQAVSGGTVTVEGDLKINYPPEADSPGIGSEFRFDLNLQISDRRDNLVLDVATVFTEAGEAYFKLDGLSISDRPANLSETTFAGRWGNLQDLLQAQAGVEGAVLEENESFLLNYVANLLNLYSYPRYLVLLPTFNISQSQHYNRVKEMLLASKAYELDVDSCNLNGDVEMQCRLRIDYGRLYDLYGDIYDVLGRSMPAYYEILKIADNPGSNLPTTVDIVFDKSRNYPVSLMVPMSASDISASSLTVEYSSFDEPNFEPAVFADPLVISEYHDQILRYEEGIDFGS